MQISQVKTADDFNNSQVPAGKLLVWLEFADGKATFHCKDENGEVSQISGTQNQITNDAEIVTGGAVTLDTYKYIYSASVSADTTFTFDISGLGALTNKVVTFELHIDMTVVSTLTFPAAVSWIDTPVFSGTGKYVLVFRTTDGGANWLGNLAYRE
jgi:hypothetical protein